MKKKGLKIFLATAMCIFNLFVCFSGVLAWFSASKMTDTSGMNIEVHTYDVGFEYKIYKYNESLGAAEDCTADEQHRFDLLTYDSILTDRNTYTPIIVEFSITGMSLSEIKPITFTISCSESSPSERALSNIIGVRFSQINTILDGDTVDQRWNKAVNYLRPNQDTTFRTLGEPDTKTTSISYSLTNYATNTIKLFMMLDYSPDLVSHGFAVGHTEFMSNESSFDQDLTTLLCSVPD